MTMFLFSSCCIFRHVLLLGLTLLLPEALSYETMLRNGKDPSETSQTSSSFLSSLPSSSPTESPPHSPNNLDTCEDSVAGDFFVDEQRGRRDCIWLAKRPSWQSTLCVVEHDAFHTCPETCGKCSDECHDAVEDEFWVNNVQRYKKCSWLAVSPGFREDLCHFGHDAFELCKDTCSNCFVPTATPSQYPTISLSPSVTPSVSPSREPSSSPSLTPTQVPSASPSLTPTKSPSRSPSATPSNSPTQIPSDYPTLAPSEAPVYIDPCDDSIEETFFVDETRGERGCIWLAKKPEWQTTLCDPEHDAYSVCAETCGKCTDACHDDMEQVFWVNNVQRYQNCSWLAISPGWRYEICHKDHAAYELCRETCDNCLPPTLSPTISPTVSLSPSALPSLSPSVFPSSTPTSTPSVLPTTSPTDSPTETPTIAPTGSPTDQPTSTPTASPTSHPTLTPSGSPSEQPVSVLNTCEDTLGVTFFVDNDWDDRDCTWLARRPQWHAVLCVDGHDAFDICEETCGKCSDECHDDSEEVFWVNNAQGYRDCAWLSLLPSWQALLCYPEHSAYDLCQESCNSCL